MQDPCCTPVARRMTTQKERLLDCSLRNFFREAFYPRANSGDVPFGNGCFDFMTSLYCRCRRRCHGPCGSACNNNGLVWRASVLPALCIYLQASSYFTHPLVGVTHLLYTWMFLRLSWHGCWLRSGMHVGLSGSELTELQVHGWQAKGAEWVGLIGCCEPLPQKSARSKDLIKRVDL